MDFIGKRNIFFGISLVVILPGLISLFLWGLNPSIDFVGGTRETFIFPKTVSNQTEGKIVSVYQADKIEVSTLQTSGNELIIRSALIDEQQHTKLIQDLVNTVGSFKEASFETIGPTISSEITRNAVEAVVVASVLIVLFIAYSFRTVPKPASSWRFGVTAIAALLHDVLVLLGVFSILGHFLHVEVDSLFVTAVLTVIGFSVHDTIVVYDRIRENLRRMTTTPFAEVVNASIMQTLNRSLNTSFTVLLVLLALLLFGGETIRWFVVALFVGVLSGTYSSIFNASPLLVVWHNRRLKKNTKKSKS